MALILVILFISFHWRINSWLVLANLPFSLIGSVFAIAITGVGIYARNRGGTGNGVRGQAPVTRSCSSRTMSIWSRSRERCGMPNW